MVDVPAMNYLMIDGQGDPNTSQQYVEAIEALYSVSYGLKFAVKKTTGQDYSVMPLEGLWWTDGPGFDARNKGSWKWTAMIMQPPLVNKGNADSAVLEVQKKKDLPAVAKIKFDELSEGAAAQVTHIGPYSEEGPAIERLHEFIASQGFVLSGRHHEIYLGDPRRTAPEKLKTIIRQPVSGK